MEEANLKECKYCTPKEGACYGESLKTDFNQIDTRIDGLNGCLDIRGNNDDDMVLINFCPMCGRDVSEGHD